MARGLGSDWGPRTAARASMSGLPPHCRQSQQEGSTIRNRTPPRGVLDFDLLDGGELVGGDVVYLNKDVPRVQARLRRDSPRFRRRLRQTGQAPSPRMLPPLLVYSCPLPFSLSCFVRRAGVVQFMQMRWIRTAVPVVPFWRLAGTTRRRTVCVPSARSSASMCTYG